MISTYPYILYFIFDLMFDDVGELTRLLPPLFYALEYSPNLCGGIFGYFGFSFS